MKTKIFLMVICLLTSSLSFATTFNDLVQQDKVQLKSWLKTTTPIAQGEEMLLYIEVQSQIPLAGDIKINRFDMNDVIVMQQGKVPLIDKTIDSDDEHYHTQRWAIKMYPLKSGNYAIAPLAVKVSLELDGERLSGKLLTKPASFSVNIPSAYMSEDHFWLSAKEVKLEQSWEIVKPEPSLTATRKDMVQEHHSDGRTNELTDMLNVGYAIKRKVTLSGFETASMLFPKFINDQAYQIKGVKAYVAQDEYFDIDEAKGSFGEHIENITLMVVEPGLINLPEIEFFWWDTKTDKMKTIILPGKVINVSHTPLSFLRRYGPWLFMSLVLLISAVGLLYKARIKWLNDMPVPLGYKFYKAIFAKQYSSAETVLYKQNRKRHNTLGLQGHQQNVQTAKWQHALTTYQQLRYAKNIDTSKERRPDLKFLLIKLWRKLPD